MPMYIDRYWYENYHGQRYYKDENVYEYEPMVRSQSEIDEIDYISEIAMELMNTDPEDRRPVR